MSAVSSGGAPYGYGELEKLANQVTDNALKNELLKFLKTCMTAAGTGPDAPKLLEILDKIKKASPKLQAAIATIEERIKSNLSALHPTLYDKEKLQAAIPNPKNIFEVNQNVQLIMGEFKKFSLSSLAEEIGKDKLLAQAYQILQACLQHTKAVHFPQAEKLAGELRKKLEKVPALLEKMPAEALQQMASWLFAKDIAAVKGVSPLLNRDVEQDKQLERHEKAEKWLSQALNTVPGAWEYLPTDNSKQLQEHGPNVRFFPTLRFHLEMNAMKDDQAALLRWMLPYLPNLETLSYTIATTDPKTLYLICQLHKLKTLQVAIGYHRKLPHSFGPLPPSLHTLALDGNEITESDIARLQLSHLKQLESFSLTTSQAQASVCHNLAPSVKAVSLTHLPNYTGLGAALSHLTKLESLACNTPPIFNRMVEIEVADLEGLPRSLNKFDCRHLQFTDLPTDFSKLTQLEKCVFIDTPIQDATLKKLPQNSIRVLILSACKLLTDAGLLSIPLSVVELDLSGIENLTDQTFINLARLSRLEVLTVDSPKMKGKNLEQLPQSLRILRISYLLAFSIDEKALKKSHPNLTIIRF